MSVNTPEEELRKIWALIPEVRCRGRCQESCGPIAMSDAERELIDRDQPVPFPTAIELMNRLIEDPGGFHCPLLSPLGRCTVYQDRPTVCRLWGAEATMKCPWGCEPVEGHLTHDEGMAILQMAMEAGGG